MKKYLPILVGLLLVTATLESCKKEAAVAAPKDYSASIKDKYWWGTLTNAGETVQYYSVHFNADNSLAWSQLSGDYTGKWSIEGNKITLTFTSPAVIVTADISDDDKLAHITTNTANKVNSCEQVQGPAPDLTNTDWDCHFSGILNFTALLAFKNGTSAQLPIGGTSGKVFNWQRTGSGGAIRFDNNEIPLFMHVPFLAF